MNTNPPANGRQQAWPQVSKRQLQAMLDQSGANLSKLCDDLGVAKSTASRWRDRVPGYAVWYAKARMIMTSEQLERMRKD